MNYSTDDQHPHRVWTEYSLQVFWKRNEDGHFCAGTSNDCDEVELGSRYESYPEYRFEMPRQKHELEKMERLMSLAYERGKIDQKIAIGRMMKGLIEL